MTLLSLLVFFVVIGIVLWAINAFIPMDAQVKRIMNIAIIIFLVLWVAQAFNLLGPLQSIRIGK